MPNGAGDSWAKFDSLAKALSGLLIPIVILLGIACTAIVEAITSWLRLRSTNLENALTAFFEEDLTEKEKSCRLSEEERLILSVAE